MHDLMEKLAISKKIMDKHNQTPRGEVKNINIPENSISETVKTPNIKNNISLTNDISKDAVLSSKLPDEIKKLMLENPISKAEMNGPVLSDELIRGATMLMNDNKEITEQQTTFESTNNNDLKLMIRDVVRDTVRDVVKEELLNSGLLSETTQKTNETLSLRVGNHIFEGKVLKIKKVK